MPIRVTCAGCHTRFNVSEKFAGKEGPCPKCKKTIQIPSAAEEVQVHTPQEFGPKTASGQAVFKPITRQDTRLTPVQWILIAATIVGFLVIAVMLRSSVTDKSTFPWWILLIASMAVAVPCVYAGYTFLRNSDLGSIQGRELFARIAACVTAYGLSWLMIPIVSYAVGPEIGAFIGVGLMIAVGAAVAWLFMQLDFSMGILHYGMFLGCCILLRVVAGFSALPRAEAQDSQIDDLLNASLETGSWLEPSLQLCHILFQ